MNFTKKELELLQGCVGNEISSKEKQLHEAIIDQHGRVRDIIQAKLIILDDVLFKVQTQYYLMRSSENEGID